MGDKVKRAKTNLRKMRIFFKIRVPKAQLEDKTTKHSIAYKIRAKGGKKTKMPNKGKIQNFSKIFRNKWYPSSLEYAKTIS